MATFYEQRKLYPNSSIAELKAVLELHESRGGTWQELIFDVVGEHTLIVMIRKYPRNELPETIEG